MAPHWGEESVFLLGRRELRLVLSDDVRRSLLLLSLPLSSMYFYAAYLWGGDVVIARESSCVQVETVASVFSTVFPLLFK
jgi:hypothetical protein